MRFELCGSEKNKFVEKKHFIPRLLVGETLKCYECVLRGLEAVTLSPVIPVLAHAVALLREKGLFACMMVKKAAHWPAYMPHDPLQHLPEAFDSFICLTKSIPAVDQHFQVWLSFHRDMRPRIYCHTMSTSTPVDEASQVYKRFPIGQDKTKTELRLVLARPLKVSVHYSLTRNAVDQANAHRKRCPGELVATLYCAHPIKKWFYSSLHSSKLTPNLH